MSTEDVKCAAAAGEKVVIYFRPVGNAPLLKQSKFKVLKKSTIKNVQGFLSRQLHLDEYHSPFVYVNGAFAPSPEQIIGDLFNCFAVDDCLVMNYSTATAWG